MKRCPNCGWPMTGKTCQHCKNEDYDNQSFFQYASPMLIDKTLNTLEGILTGISIDKVLVKDEMDELYAWCSDHSSFAEKPPYDELFQSIFTALDDHILTLEEKDNLLWLIHKLHQRRKIFR